MSREHFLHAAGGFAIHRNDIEFERGQFPRARRHGGSLCPPGARTRLRVEFFGDEIERITRFEPLTGRQDRSAAKA